MEETAAENFWLSAQQQQVWLRQAGDNPWNASILARIDGSVDKPRLRDAMEQLIHRHEVLRTGFRHHPGMKVPFQSPRETGSLIWSETSLPEASPDEAAHRLQGIFDAELALEFDLSTGPFLRVHCIEVAAQPAFLILSTPALLSDAPSLATLLRDAAALYVEEAKPAEDPIRYVQISQWQNDLLESEDETAREAKTFWDRPDIALPSPASLPFASTLAGPFRPASVSFSLSDSRMSFDYTPEVVFLAAWQCLMWRFSGQTLFGARMFFDGREHEDLQNAAGLIGRFLPIPARFDGDFSFIDVLDHVKGAMTAAAEWQEYCPPVGENAAGVAVSFEYFGGQPSWTGGPLSLSILRQQAHIEPFGIKLSVLRLKDSFRCTLFFDQTILDHNTVEGWMGNFETLLAAAIQNPQQPVSQLRLLTESERTRILVEWNQTSAAYPRERCIHELFEAEATRTPDRPAVRSHGRELTYGELNKQSNRLARHLKSLGVRRGDSVGLCLERGVDLIVGLLAILKAGAAYVPLNADNPKLRLTRQLNSCAALLTESGLVSQMPEFGRPVVSIDSESSRWDNQPPENLDTGASPDDLVYVIYTSGSTGVPKGVAVRHRNLVNYATYIKQWLKLDEFPNGLNFATVSTIAADLGNTCIYPCLTGGGCLHIASQETATDVALMTDFNREYGIDVLKIVPSHLDALLASPAADVLPAKYLILGGELFPRSLAHKIAESGASCQVLNHYGPTETTVGSLTLTLPNPFPAGWPAHSVPIGRPISNTRAYVLDPRLEPVPAGVSGELYIGGDGVTAGYLDSPELTAERFLANPFVAGDRIYRTGDLARFLADGNVECLGRTDDQVKIRGYRIELGEIEAALCRFEGIKQAVVSVQPAKTGERQLAAYLVPARGREISIASLLEYLRGELPGYMIPAAMVILTKLPLTPNGKLDRASLPDPETAQSEVRQYAAPKTVTEAAVANIWTEVFKRDRIGVTDDFFRIGGHSLLATQVISRVREQFRVEIAMQTLFESPTIQALSRAIDEAPEAVVVDDEPAIVPVSRDGYRRRSQ